MRLINDVFVWLLNIPAVTAALPFTAFFSDPRGIAAARASAAKVA